MDFCFPEQIASTRIPGIDAVFHTVSPNESFIKNSPYQATAQGVLAIRAILDFCRNNHIKRFVYFSSFHALGVQAGEINERIPPQPINDYGFIHYIAEQTVAYYARAYHIEGTCIRLSNVYGLPAAQGRITRWNLTPFSFCREALLNRKIVLHSSGEQKRNFVHISNVLSCVQFALENPQFSLLHCYGDETCSIYDFAKCVCQCVGDDVTLERLEGSGAEAQSALHFYSLYFQSQKTSLSDYIVKMCAYIKQLK